ncbi:hypothetical protein DPMN_152411 [Dreissena polymorpha]|uniref:Secreted protein n=1 Tax=Dreissena polymorpha TaxID=45954 RepID=A0A9D4FKC6_DREPO|nr:hypothetical protein DPMN_152411 [Dreissena polymorpha]
MFKCLYLAFCAVVKRLGLEAPQCYGGYKGLEELDFCEEADGATCPQPTQSGHRCGPHGLLYRTSAELVISLNRVSPK